MVQDLSQDAFDKPDLNSATTVRRKSYHNNDDDDDDDYDHVYSVDAEDDTLSNV